ncbi:hypothetical protein PMZ80_010223 [Knufia obscura]|uniref:Mog1p/PsbP-like protein n=2 Tax=Knufia TaxID=430999 RepID=A0AAN8EKM1_9EURO|nr:hypothetical protein PMZ80_010223 [Knufia obscura]KAK5952962.1 hypothetical protein OHC33_006083 [Knufia fluminis]
MSSQYSRRGLYGGAITVSLPADSIDGSDLRQIPDHQEVFLRQDTLTSIIFEINEYQTPATVDHANAISSTGSTNLTTTNTSIPPSDSAAATYHLNDTIIEPDYLSPDGIETTSIKLAQPSLTAFPVYLSAATIITPEIDHSAKSTLPVNWQSNPIQKEYQTKTQQLLIRMKEYGTDLCVRVNVPMKEFGGVQSEAALTEVARADQIMKTIIESLNIKDFGLFGGGE